MKNHAAVPAKTPPATARQKQESQVARTPLHGTMPGVTTKGEESVTDWQLPSEAAGTGPKPQPAQPPELLAEVRRFNELTGNLMIILSYAVARCGMPDSEEGDAGARVNKQPVAANASIN